MLVKLRCPFRDEVGETRSRCWPNALKTDSPALELKSDQVQVDHQLI